MKNKPCPKGEWKDQKPRPKKRRARKKLVAVRVLDDEREVCNKQSAQGRAEYKRRTLLMALRQDWYCGLRLPGCDVRLTLDNVTFEHVEGRGMGGSRRDDRTEKDGKPYNLAACWGCNAEKGSKRISGDRAAVAQEKEQ